ncbi:MAG: recombinase family protein [Bryobacterales bacterium]|nr:recombinase family protein [Bryobacterales bacterium]
MRIGYARVSTVDQDPDLQIRALKQARCERIYTEHASGVSRSRPELVRLFDSLRTGDTLVVWRFDRLGRSVSHLVEVVEQLRTRNVGLESLTEGIDTSSAAGEAVFTIIAAFAQMERRLISERTRAGIDAARRNNRPWGKASKFHDSEIVKLVQSLLREGSLSKADIARRVGIHPCTLYRWFPGGEADNFQPTPTYHRRQKQRAQR